jgi:hypothetical protein
MKNIESRNYTTIFKPTMNGNRYKHFNSIYFEYTFIRLGNMHLLWIFFISFTYLATALNGQSLILKGLGFERHSELSWNLVGANASDYEILLSMDGINFTHVVSTTDTNYFYFTDGTILDDYYVKVHAYNGLQTIVATSNIVWIKEEKMSDDDLLDMIQRYHFRYFWDFGHPTSGLARERNTSEDIVTIGGSGFGIMAILVGIENGYITREEGLNRLIKIVGFLSFADKFHGVFPHWMNGKTGNVVPFSQYDNGGDLVETAFLIEGLLTARAFFDQNTNKEVGLRQAITSIWENVEWDFYSRNNSGSLYWHWSPTYNWQMNFRVKGYNEALIVYLLAISSPTHSVAASYWDSGWAGNGYKNGSNYYNVNLPVGPAYGGPLFFAHYSYMGFDPRGLKDKYTNYFTQNVNHSRINHAYCVKNPLNHKDYSYECWGLTASDDPNGYLAHEPTSTKDNGTISPTAALSSMPYTPVESMAALKHFYFDRGDKLLGKYGFYDAFNPSKNWIANSYLAIDQGPIVCMIQNHRTELLWKNFMKNVEIRDGLEKIGFKADPNSIFDEKMDTISIYPNPATDYLFIGDIGKNKEYSILNFMGELVIKSNTTEEKINVSALPNGVYFLHGSGKIKKARFVKI